MSTRNLFLLLFAFVIMTPLTQAQEMSWRKHRKLAESLEKEGDLFAAAENYRMAWEKKQSKELYIYKAAEIYYNLRDYRAAADAYQHVPAPYEEDQLVLLKYGRALKQDGQYDKARTVLQQLSDNYTGQDRAILQDIIRVELQGVNLSGSMGANMDRRLELLHPGGNVNSDNEEFGPAAVGEDVLYFTSTAGGQARIFESRRQGQNWTKADAPAGFPVVEGGQYSNGAMSPDQQRLYFTICNNDNGWEGFNTRCEIYVTKRSANGWTAPERLPDFINVKGVNTTTPAVAHYNGQEFLYFASNREGGRGGLDLWYVTRDLGTDNLDFTFPVNLGPVVNSLGDEVTPYYDVEAETLYYSSNGLPALGGLDIFKSTGNEVNWTTPINVGLPLNSGADDYGYTRNPSGFGGYFSSNRVFGGEKTNTRNEDIFEYSVGGRQITLKALVYEKESGEALDNVSVSLFQLFEDGSENLLITKDFATGSYLFELLPNRRFRVEVEREGYEPGGYVFATDDPSTFTYGQPLFLDSTGDVPSTDGGFMTETPTTTDPVSTTDGGMVNPPTSNPSSGIPMTTGDVEYTLNASGPKDNARYTSNASRYDGEYFRVQIAALGRYQADSPKFSSLPNFGTVATEFMESRGLTRVLVGDYFNQSEATFALDEIRKVHPDAYIVKYTDGVRYGRVNF